MKFLPSKTGSVVLPIAGGIAAIALTYFVGKKLVAEAKEYREENESDNVDANNPKLKLASQLASRANVAMGGSWDNTDSNELNKIATEIYRQGPGFFELVANSFKKLTGGKSLLKTIQEESSTGEYARFIRCLNTGKYEADSWLDGLRGIGSPQVLQISLY